MPLQVTSEPDETTSVAVPEPAGLTDSEIRVLTALRRILRGAALHSRHLSATASITAPQLVCLLKIVEHDGLSSRQLAGHVSLSPSTLVGIVDRLEAKRLVVRQRSARDRRVVELHATEEGRSLVRRAPSPLQERFVLNLRGVDAERRENITAALEEVVQLMDVENVPAEPVIETRTELVREPGTRETR